VTWRGDASVIGALACGVAAAAIVAACVRPAPRPTPNRDEIMALWTQIRDWRHEAGLNVEPEPASILATRRLSVQKARVVRSCPPVPPKACYDVCSLADAICDNAERICSIAAETPGDAWAAEKCDSAKASCREAKDRCCACEEPG
jgi:hypothetical protein